LPNILSESLAPICQLKILFPAGNPYFHFTHHNRLSTWLLMSKLKMCGHGVHSQMSSVVKNVWLTMGMAIGGFVECQSNHRLYAPFLPTAHMVTLLT
jgi:hypothetical protein